MGYKESDIHLPKAAAGQSVAVNANLKSQKFDLQNVTIPWKPKPQILLSSSFLLNEDNRAEREDQMQQQPSKWPTVICTADNLLATLTFYNLSEIA